MQDKRKIQTPMPFFSHNQAKSGETIGLYKMGLNMHIGLEIKNKLQEKNISIVSFARQLSYTRANIYKILDKKSIDTDLLLRISIILRYDFFSFYQHEFKDKLK